MDVEPDDYMPGEMEGATFTFRIMHLLERAYYASGEMITSLFGLGFMSEGSDYTMNNFNFFIGLDNEETGFVNQVDTSDIAWSIFVIRFGLIGTVLYLIYYFSLIKFFNKRYDIGCAKAVFSTLCMIFITTFTSITIVSMEFIALMLFVYVLIRVDKREDKEETLITE
jgi:hypothetical protein